MALNAIKILSNEDTLKRFKTNSLIQAKKFDIANILPVYERYYEKVLKESVQFSKT